MMDYQTIDELMREPANEGLTRVEVFAKPYVGIVPIDVINKHYQAFQKQVEEDTARINDITYFHSQQQQLSYLRDYSFNTKQGGKNAK